MFGLDEWKFRKLQHYAGLEMHKWEYEFNMVCMSIRFVVNVMIL